MLLKLRAWFAERNHQTTWRQFAMRFIATFGIGLTGIYLFVLLLDPYNVVGFSLPIERPLVSINQRYMYPQVVRSGRFDSLVIGTSTSRLLDPEILNAEFDAKFANLAMDSATAWEQKTLARYFIDRTSKPKVLIVGIDVVWCARDADRNRITFRGFPDFLYDDTPWNDYLYLLNTPTIEMAGRLAGYHLHLYPERSRYDGFQVFVPPDNTYDADKARRVVWGDPPRIPRDPDQPLFQLSDTRRRDLAFPALEWLDDLLTRMPDSLKILAFMPVHVAAQPAPASEEGAVEAECKRRIVAIAAKRGARVIDWRYSSALTRNDSNYWDSLHYRLPIAQRLARQLGQAIRDRRPSDDGTYRLLSE